MLLSWTRARFRKDLFRLWTVVNSCDYPEFTAACVKLNVIINFIFTCVITEQAISVEKRPVPVQTQTRSSRGESGSGSAHVTQWEADESRHVHLCGGVQRLQNKRACSQQQHLSLSKTHKSHEWTNRGPLWPQREGRQTTAATRHCTTQTNMQLWTDFTLYSF